MTNDVTGLQARLAGYRLTTAEILYHLPDHPSVLQSFVWQQMDLAPKFPVLTRFLDFWRAEIEGELHSVKVQAASLITPSRWRHVDGVLRLH